MVEKLKGEEVFFLRAEQQLNIQKAIRRLAVDVERSMQLGKSKVDSLEDLEQRIMALRRGLKNPYANLRHAAVEVDEDLRKDTKAVLTQYITQCPRYWLVAYPVIACTL